MSIWRQVRRGVDVLLHREAADRELSDELEHYMTEAEAAYGKQGLSAAEARRRARMDAGPPAAVHEEVRSAGWEHIVESVWADFRYAFRRLRANPGFTFISVLTLALGIGATTTIFGVVNPILIASLPYHASGRLVVIEDHKSDGSPLGTTFGTYRELSARSRSFRELAVTDAWRPSLTAAGEPERIVGQRVSADFFRTLGVAPSLGRDFEAREDVVGGPQVVVLSDRLAVRRFGSGAAAIGQEITLDDNQYLVIGIMPRDFTSVLVPTADAWTPLQRQFPAPFQSVEWGHHYTIVGQLAPGASVQSTARELDRIAKSPVPEFARPSWADLSSPLTVTSLRDVVARDATPALLAIVGAALLLLTIACVNVTNLLLARGVRRHGEFAMRMALGARRVRIVRQLLTESLVLCLVGGVLGLGVAAAGVQGLVALSPAQFPRLDAIRLDPPVFAFAFVATTIVGVVVGLAPALTAVRAGLQHGVQLASRRSAGGRGVAQGALVVAEVALALVLLTGTGLLMRSLGKLFGVAPGFDARNRLTMLVTEAGHRYDGDVARKAFWDAALGAVREVPGVQAAAFTSLLPLTGPPDSYGYQLPSRTAAQPIDADGSATRYVVTPGYFSTMGIPLQRGRLLDATDVPGAPVSIVVSQSLARRLFPGVDPIGQRIRFGPQQGDDAHWPTIVGVVGDVKESLALPQTDAFYAAEGQWPWVDNVQALVVKTRGDAAALAPAVKRAVWSVDANQPIQFVATMEATLRHSVAQRRFVLVVIESFAIVALALAAIGLYGVIAGGVTERAREIGIRTALGASSQMIVRSVVGRGMALTAGGVAIGAVSAVATSRLLESFLFGVSRVDPPTYVGVVLLLGGVAVLASWVPAVRASRVDPIAVLRAE